MEARVWPTTILDEAMLAYASFARAAFLVLGCWMVHVGVKYLIGLRVDIYAVCDLLLVLQKVAFVADLGAVVEFLAEFLTADRAGHMCPPSLGNTCCKMLRII